MCVKSRKVNKLPPWAFEELANSSDDEMMSFTLLSAKECQKQHEDELCRRARNIQVPLSRPDGISVSKVFTGMYSQIEFCPSEDEDEFEWRKVPLSGEQADIQKKWEQTHNKKYYQTRKAKLAREKEHAEWLAERAKKEALEERAKMRARLALDPEATGEPLPEISMATEETPGLPGTRLEVPWVQQLAEERMRAFREAHAVRQQDVSGDGAEDGWGDGTEVGSGEGQEDGSGEGQEDGSGESQEDGSGEGQEDVSGDGVEDGSGDGAEDCKDWTRENGEGCKDDTERKVEDKDGSMLMIDPEEDHQHRRHSGSDNILVIGRIQHESTVAEGDPQASISTSNPPEVELEIMAVRCKNIYKKKYSRRKKYILT